MTLPQGFSDTEMLWVAAGLWLQSERIFVAMFFSDFPGNPYNVDLIWVPQLHVATKHFGVHVKGKFSRQPKKKNSLTSWRRPEKASFGSCVLKKVSNYLIA